jgi:hypothetical protein
MTKEEKFEIGQRIKIALKSHSMNQADLARKFVEKYGRTFNAAQKKISLIINGEFEPDNEFWICLYELIEANIGFLLTEKGDPHVKPFK